MGLKSLKIFIVKKIFGFFLFFLFIAVAGVSSGRKIGGKPSVRAPIACSRKRPSNGMICAAVASQAIVWVWFP